MVINLGNLGDFGKYATIIGVVILIISVVSVLASIGTGIKTVKPTEVGVKINYITGSKEILATPGNKLYIPLIQGIEILNSSPQKFVMQGDRNIDTNHVRKLTVRAIDGSNFYFDEVEIQYQLIPSKAGFILEDSGKGDAFKDKWIRALARNVLRDEFGRHTADDIANPTTYNTATIASQEVLNKLLNPHGIEATQIVTPKPRFEARYEKAIEDRINAVQEIEKQKVKRDQLVKEREFRLAKIDRDKNEEYQNLLGNLEAEKTKKEKDQIRVQREADAYKIAQVADGEAKRLEAITRAKANEEKYKKQAEGLAANTKALEEQGEVVIYRTIAEKFSSFKIRVVPYSLDSTPKRLEYVPIPPTPAQSR
ncbi:MAG: hypothetical protein HY731_13860 [Candidatus Tectomicrobia bacterium]|nr:hypothetical protein [Candidatus Tectomicrobia bacterium]